MPIVRESLEDTCSLVYVRVSTVTHNLIFVTFDTSIQYKFRHFNNLLLTALFFMFRCKKELGQIRIHIHVLGMMTLMMSSLSSTPRSCSSCPTRTGARR